MDELAPCPLCGSEDTYSDGVSLVFSASYQSPFKLASVVLFAGCQSDGGLARVDDNGTTDIPDSDGVTDVGADADDAESPELDHGSSDGSTADDSDAVGMSDEPEPSDVLVLSLSGNDFNRECDDGWGEWGSARQERALAEIEEVLEYVIRQAIDTRPNLDVVMIGYDYFHFEFLVAFGLSLDGLDTNSYNEGLVELGRVQRAIAARYPNVNYTNNYGILQHHYGDTIHPPFSRPNPFTGYPEYPAGVAPKPTGPPEYTVYPGGFYTYPAPLNAMPDGIHPSPEAMGVILDNALDQVLEAVLDAHVGE